MTHTWHVRADLTGGSDIVIAFDQLSRSVRGRIAREALKAGSVPIVAAIRSAAPRGKTGLLASGFRARMPRQDRPGRIAMLIQSVTTRGKFEAKHPRKKVAAGNATD